VATQITSKACNLYQTDVYAWAMEQAELLKSGRLHELDAEHLIDAIEGLAMAEWGAAKSHAQLIIEHLLKLQHSPAQDPRNGWRNSVRTQRRELENVLTPTLRRRLEEDLGRLYGRVRRDVVESLRDYGEHEAADALPPECPYTLDDLLGEWLPEGVRGLTGGSMERERGLLD
jgi:hypothetical protein